MSENYAPTTHDVAKCTCCGTVGQMKPGPLLRGSDILWICLLMIAAAILEDDFPRFLWLLAALGQLLNAAGILYSYRQHGKK